MLPVFSSQVSKPVLVVPSPKRVQQVFSQDCKFCHKEEIVRMLQNFKYMHDSSCTGQLGCLDVSCIRSNNTSMWGEIKLRSSKSLQVW